MKTDVDTALKDIANFFIKNRREITAKELKPILTKHCQSDAEAEKFLKFLDTEPGQLRFKTHLRERKGVSFLKKPSYVWVLPPGLPFKKFSNVKEAGFYIGRFLAGKLRGYGAFQKTWFPDWVTPDSITFFDTVPEGVEVKVIWGDENILNIRSVTYEERDEFEQGIAEGWDFGPLEKPSSLIVEEPCEIISPQYYDILGLLDSVPPTSLLLEPEVKETKLDEILKKLKDGVDAIQSSPVFREFLITLSKFHDYSIGNCILIMFQKPAATRVAGFNTWKDLGRYVKKGEKGIAILAPCLPPKAEAVEETWRNRSEWVLKPRFGYGWSVYRRDIGLTLIETFPTKGEAESWLIRQGARKVSVEPQILAPRYFKVVYVFDVSQTEGKPLPKVEIAVLSVAANEQLFSKALSLARSEGLKVSFEPRPELDPRVKGQFIRPDKIWVRPEESRADQLGALLHEEAHYFTEEVFRIPRADAETIAESVCFAVSANFGFDTGVSSFPYVALWAREKKVLENNLNTLRKVSITMIQKLEAVKVSELREPIELSKEILEFAHNMDIANAEFKLGLGMWHSLGDWKIKTEDLLRQLKPGEVLFMRKKTLEKTIFYSIERIGDKLELKDRSYTDTMTVPVKPRPVPEGQLEYLPDSPEFLTQTIDATGYRGKLDNAFQEAIGRAKGLLKR